MLVIFEYKCRRCAEAFDGEELHSKEPAEVLYDSAINRATAHIRVDAVRLHTCTAGETKGIGVGDLIGLRVIAEDDAPPSRPTLVHLKSVPNPSEPE